MNKKLLVGLAVLVLATLACALPSIGGTSSVGSNVLFQDDFSSTGSGWDRYEDSDMFTDYADGAYRIEIFIPSYWAWANPGESFSGDVSISVDATMTGGPLDNGFGVICHYQDVENFDLLIVSSDGYAGIAQRLNGGDIVLISGDQMVTSDAIRQGMGATNTVRADCIGSSLTLYANGTRILDATDSSLSGGDAGLIATTFSEAGVQITFDNFVVTRP